MSSAGQIIGGLLGAVTGAIIGGPTGALYGAQIGSTLGGIVDPARAKGTTTEGPRLDDLSVQTATYGAMIGRTYGNIVIDGNVFWVENNRIKQTINISRSGGGGGKGGRKKSKNKTITYAYSGTFAVGLCQVDANSFLNLRRIWIRGQLFYDAEPADSATLQANLEAERYFTFKNGWDLQAPSARIQATLGAANTPAWRGVAYILFEDLPLAKYGNSLQGVEVRVEVICAEDGPTTVYLKDIVSSECLRSGVLSAADIDVTALTQVVRGYRINSAGTLRSAIEPLQSAWPFDVVQRGYKLAFVPRGGTSVRTIPETELDARPSGSAPGAKISFAREINVALPRCINLRYLDVTREYNLGVALEERTGADDSNEVTLDLPIVLHPDEAAGIAQVLLRLAWLERTEWRFTVAGAADYGFYGKLEPADVVSLATPEGTQELRLTAINYTSDNRLECTGRPSHAPTYTPAAVGYGGLVTADPSILPIGPSVYQLLDLPLVSESQSLPGILGYMYGSSDGWPGGSVLQSVDGGSSWVGIADFVPPSPTVGTASTVIGTVDQRLIDASSVLTVTLAKGALYHCTLPEMLSGRNRFAYGADGRWEIISARTCTQITAMDYVLSDFLRGQNGTEWAMSTHQTGDALILLEFASIESIAMDSGSIGMSRLYRGITDEAAIDSDTNRTWTYQGINLKPLAPINLTGSIAPGSNDWSITWLRRTRAGGDWRDLVDAMLGEDVEAYSIEIYASGAYATLKRTISASAPTCSYSSADQTTDFGAPQTTLYLKIYQLSTVLGRGYPLTTSITR